MNAVSCSPDFPFTIISREDEIIEASEIASVNKRVCNFFESLMKEGGYSLAINGQNVLLEGAKDVDIAYRLFLASPKPNQEYRHQQAKRYFKQTTAVI